MQRSEQDRIAEGLQVENQRGGIRSLVVFLVLVLTQGCSTKQPLGCRYYRDDSKAWMKVASAAISKNDCDRALVSVQGVALEERDTGWYEIVALSAIGCRDSGNVQDRADTAMELLLQGEQRLASNPTIPFWRSEVLAAMGKRDESASALEIARKRAEDAAAGESEELRREGEWVLQTLETRAGS